MRAFDVGQTQSSLFDALVAASRKYGVKKPILEDQERNPLTYLDLIRASFALGRKLAGMTPRRMAWRFAVIFWTLFGVVTGIQVWISHSKRQVCFRGKPKIRELAPLVFGKRGCGDHGGVIRG